MHPNENALVLDFFAGSGSTGQAVLDLNNDDGGNRKFILVQIAEKLTNNKFESVVDITKQRIQKVIEKKELKNEGFKYFCLSESNIDEDLSVSELNDSLNIYSSETLKMMQKN